MARPGAAAQAAGMTAPGGRWVLGVLIFSSTCIIVGLLWDISWHMSIGRDTLWSPPHVLEQIGAALAGLACGWLALRTTFGGSPADRAHAVRFWGFRAPLGAWVAIWGALAMIFSVPFDDWWHNAYGLDVEILSPPHIVLLSGMIGIQLGAVLLATGHQNRSDERRRRRLGLTYAFAAGAMIAMVATTLSEFTIQPNLWRSSLAVQVSALAFPVFLVAAARAGRLPFAATITAAFYMGVYLVTQWVLVQFPATPRLTPITYPVDRMVAFGFPLLLVAPALVIDLVHRRSAGMGEWRLAAVLGVGFVAALVAVQWPVSGFLIGSPLAHNDFFLANHYPYFSSPGAFRYRFWSPMSGWAEVAAGVSIAALLGVLSSRVGLAWGAWLRRVQR
jgi:hypothetical protein